MFIEGIGISGYRSFGGPIQLIGPFSKVNLFIGQNNSGKSNILLFLTYHYKQALLGLKKQKTPLSFQQIDRPLNSSSEEILLSFPIFQNSDSWNALSKLCEEKQADFNKLKKVLESKIFCNEPNIPWLTVKGNFGQNNNLEIPQLHFSKIFEENVLQHGEWSQLWQKLLNMGQGDIKRHWIPDTLNWIKQNIPSSVPNITLIPAIRRVEQGDNTLQDDFSGLGNYRSLSETPKP